MKTDKIIRIGYGAYRRIRRLIPGERGETMRDYFNRVAKLMDMRF